MSQPKRYYFTSPNIKGVNMGVLIHEDDQAPFVKYSDYELLRQEFSHLAEERHTTIRALELQNERLTKERDHYRWASINDGIACNERARENQDLENQIDALKAENERLREAGDDMDAYLKRLDGTTNGVLDCRRNWLAAKEVQS